MGRTANEVWADKGYGAQLYMLLDVVERLHDVTDEGELRRLHQQLRESELRSNPELMVRACDDVARMFDALDGLRNDVRRGGLDLGGNTARLFGSRQLATGARHLLTWLTRVREYHQLLNEDADVVLLQNNRRECLSWHSMIATSELKIAAVHAAFENVERLIQSRLEAAEEPATG